MVAAIVASGLIHGSISLGAGTAFDYAGARAELRVGHVALSAASGFSLVGINLIDSNGQPNREVDGFPALSLRFFSGDGGAFVAAANWTNHGYQRNDDDPCCYEATARLQRATLTVGWRFRFDSGFYVEAGAGGAAAIQQSHPSLSGMDSNPGPFKRDVLFIPRWRARAGVRAVRPARFHC
jgi:hypothetical protein